MSYVDRIQGVLAETCNDLAVNGITTWEPTDFYAEAKKFVAHLQTITLLAEQIGVTTWNEAAFDMIQNLDWGIPEAHKAPCVTAGLNELYEELHGDGGY